MESRDFVSGEETGSVLKRARRVSQKHRGRKILFVAVVSFRCSLLLFFIVFFKGLFISLVYLFPISTVAPQGDCTFVIEKVKKDVVDIIFSNLNRLNLYKKIYLI